MHTELKMLAVPLSEEELRERGSRVAEIQMELDHADSEIKAQKAAHKSKAEGLDAERRHLSEEIRKKREVREVEVQIRKNWGDATIDVIRLDTGEVISSRPMTPSELQRTMNVDVN